MSEPEDRSGAEDDRGGEASFWSTISPREVLMLFTAGWLGGQGALTALGRFVTVPERVLGLAEMIAAVLWFIPKLRLAGFGAMLAVLAVASFQQIMSRHLPGALIFYAAVTIYLAVEESRRKPVS